MLFNNLPKKKYGENYEWFYNIPIEKGEQGDILVNKHFRGDNGFNNSLLSDKFFIQGTPESPRLLTSLTSLLISEVSGETETETEAQITPEQQAETETEIETEIEIETETGNVNNILSEIESIYGEDSNGEKVQFLSGFTNSFYNLNEVRSKINEQSLTEALNVLKDPNLNKNELLVTEFLSTLVGKENYDSLIRNDSNNPEKINMKKFIEYFFQGKNRDVLKYLRSIYDNINKCI